MSKQLRVLIVEDSEDDALLMILALEKGGYNPVYERVEDAAAMRKTLLEKHWDVILCDYRLPQFSGLDAIDLLNETGIDIPLIIVSGTIGEETAVECMRLGAHVYFMKDNLTRLVSAIERELKEAESRRHRKRAEDALKESERQYKLITEKITDIVWIMDMDFRTVYVTPSIMTVLGFSQEERMLQSINEQLMPDSLSSATDALVKELALEEQGHRDSNRSTTLVLEYYHKDGSTRWMETIVSGLRNDLGVLTGMHGVSRDITDRKHAEDMLLESEELFRSSLENAPDGIYMNDLEGTFLYGNRKCEEITGYRREEMIGKNFLELNLLPEKFMNKAIQLLQDNMDGKSTGPDEFELISKEGRLVPVEINTNVVQRLGQRIVLATVRDITDRNLADENLRKSEERYRTILEDMDEGYFEVDLAGNFTFVNDAECRDLGYSREEVIGINYRQYSDEATAKELYEFFNNIYNTGKPVKRFPGEFISKDGRRHFNEVSASLIRDTKGKPIGFRGISQDVTERKKAEESLKETLDSLRRSFGTTIQVMVSAIETRDPYTSGHQLRVANIARAIATEMKLPKDQIEGIRMAGSIHDIGKLSIPAEILSKPGKLSEIEFSLIKEHARKGYEMIKDVESPWPLADIVHQHHERIDGSGYPRKLKGDESLIEARILSVADVVEAMSSHRPYRPGLGIDAALNEIEKNRGIFYDKNVADACLRLFREKGFQIAGT